MHIRAKLILGDSAKELRKIHGCSMDAMVTDPPAGVAFMGKEWDTFRTRRYFIAALRFVFEHCLRILKPGAHGLVWALPRTSHWTATALEDAGFEIRDVGVHLFGSGFPKSLDVSKAATAWSGLGTALKPAAEHWILCRKPLDGTVAANMLQHGTGVLNIDGCRISTGGEVVAPGSFASDPANREGVVGCGMGPGRGKSRNEMHAAQIASLERTNRLGRWPANLTLDEGSAALLDEQSGELHGAGFAQPPQQKWARESWNGITNWGTNKPNGSRHGDSGGASRFFYVAKASRRERTRLNDHPTVKPVELMRWLCRLITPPNGWVLDPFMGSGSTGIACAREGFNFIGIERDRQAMRIAKFRVTRAYG